MMMIIVFYITWILLLYIDRKLKRW